MQTRIVKWGNSQGIRLPKMLLDSANLSDDDIIELTVVDDSIIVKKAETKKRHKTIKERFKDFEGEYVFEEWDTGAPVGEEVL